MVGSAAHRVLRFLIDWCLDPERTTAMHNVFLFLPKPERVALINTRDKLHSRLLSAKHHVPARCANVNLSCIRL